MCNSSSLFDINHFADDTTLMTSDSKLDILKLILKFQKYWTGFRANKLIINLNKTYCMLFTNKKENTTLTIRANNPVIEQNPEYIFLGIIVNNKISWKPHINHISSKVSKSTALLRFLKYIFPKHKTLIR